jgi:hypothetical protein
MVMPVCEHIIELVMSDDPGQMEAKFKTTRDWVGAQNLLLGKHNPDISWNFSGVSICPYVS